MSAATGFVPGSTVTSVIDVVPPTHNWDGTSRPVDIAGRTRLVFKVVRYRKAHRLLGWINRRLGTRFCQSRHYWAAVDVRNCEDRMMRFEDARPRLARRLRGKSVSVIAETDCVL